METDPTHDALNRRRRDRPSSTCKRVTPQERDLLWMRMIHRHGPLSSTYLHGFSQHLRRNEKRARDRLTDLFNEDRTPHGGPYLTRPHQQFATFDARYQDLVYDLAPAAELALKDAGLWSDASAAHAGPWAHRFMVAGITASIELATLGDPSLTYIPQDAILGRAGATLRHPVPFADPKTGREETRDLIPDALFGLEYATENGPQFRFFVVEADRATEPSRASSFNRKSHLRSILQYREYVGRGLYKDHLRLTAGLLVLTVATSPATTARMIALASEVSEGRGNAYMLFQTAEHFSRWFKPAKPMPELLHESWARAGREGFRIDEG